MSRKSLYDELGVSPRATAEELRKAYRRLARETHPDVNPGDTAAEERFKRVAHAFDVLSDPAKRALYDELGEEAERLGFDPERVAAHRERREAARRHRAGPWAGPPPGRGGKGGVAVDLDDLLGEVFGRAGGGRAPGAGPGVDVVAELSIAFEDAARGARRVVALDRPEPCEACGGAGVVAPRGGDRCGGCGGSGRVTALRGAAQVSTACPVCGGSGRGAGALCEPCGGRGARLRRVSLEVAIPAGVEDGQQLRLRGQGAPGLRGGPPGDLVVTVRVAPHPAWRRDGLDLLLEVPVTVREALFGAEVRVSTLEGDVKLRVPPGTQSGTRLRLRGRGIPARSGSGDLIATVVVRLPDAGRSPERARQAADLLEALYDGPVRPGS
jgi:molecular chaperone DnaJ